MDSVTISKHMESLMNQYYERIVSKTYFDSYSHEFKSKTTEDKLLILSLYLNDGGDLHFALNSYKTDRSEHTLGSLKNTLLFYNEYIRTGKATGILRILLEKYLSEYQLISLLAAELNARLTFEFEKIADYSFMKKKYKIEIGGYFIEKYLNQDRLTKKEQLISIFKGDLKKDFNLGDFNEDLPD